MSKTIQDAVIQEDGVWGKTNIQGREVNVMAWLTGSIDYLYLSCDGVLYHERNGHTALSRWQIICNQKEFEAEAQKMGYGSSRSMKGKYVMVRGLDKATYHAIGKRLVELGYEGEYPDNQYFDDFQDEHEWVFGVNEYGSNYHGDEEGSAFYNGECLTPFQMLELLDTLSDPVERGDYVFTRNIKTLSQFEAIVDKMIEAGGFRGCPCTFEDIKEYSNEQILMFDERDGEIWVYPESDDTGAIRERSIESILGGSNKSGEKTPTESVNEESLEWPIDPSLVGRKVRFEGYNNGHMLHWRFTVGGIYTIDRRHSDETFSVRDNDGTYPLFNYDNSFKFTLLPEGEVKEAPDNEPLQFPVDKSLLGRKVRFTGFKKGVHKHWDFKEGGIYTIIEHRGQFGPKSGSGELCPSDYGDLTFELLPESDWYEDGELPPVGVKCLVQVIGVGKLEWVEGEVIMHTTINGQDAVVVKMMMNGYEYITSSTTDGLKSIPEKTERDHWIDRIGELMDGSYASVEEVAGAIYDADLAKVA